jgi:hypothetical protein
LIDKTWNRKSLHLRNLRPKNSAPFSVPRRRPSGAKPVLELLEDRTLPSISWTGAAGDGNWNTGANWTGGHVPGTNDDVIIGGGTISLSSTAQIGSLTWGGGNLSGGGILEPSRGMEISGGGTLKNITLVNPAGQTARFTGGQWVDGGVFLNYGLIQFQKPLTNTWVGLSPYPSTSTGFVDNFGQVLADNSGVYSYLNLPFKNENQGTVDVRGGTLYLGQSFKDSSSNGEITAQSGTGVFFSGNWTISAPITSAGGVGFHSGITQVQAAYTADKTYSRYGSTVTFTSDVTNAHEIGNWDVGNFTFKGAVHSLGAFNFRGGIVDLSQATSVDPVVLAPPSMKMVGTTLISPYSFHVPGHVYFEGVFLTAPHGNCT